MTQIPGLNPVDTAPPASAPGAPPQVVTTATLVRLYAKLAELQRRIDILERR